MFEHVDLEIFIILEVKIKFPYNFSEIQNQIIVADHRADQHSALLKDYENQTRTRHFILSFTFKML